MKRQTIKHLGTARRNLNRAFLVTSKIHSTSGVLRKGNDVIVESFFAVSERLLNNHKPALFSVLALQTHIFPKCGAKTARINMTKKRGGNEFQTRLKMLN